MSETMGAVFSRRAAEAPHRIAVSGEDGELRYDDLERRANQLAHLLVETGVRPGDVVGVAADRGAAGIVMLLAVLKVGAAYLGMDRREPARRRELMVRDARVRVVLADAARADDLPDGPLVVVPDASAERLAPLPVTPPPVAVAAEDTAYVAYTSGSTGRPKGVCVPHRAVLRLVRGADFLDIGPDDVFLHLAPLAFDASTLEIWGALLNGGQLLIAPPRDLSTAELLGVVRAGRATAVWLTAGLFHEVVDHGLTGLPDLRYLLAGGDVLSPPHVDRAVAALPHVTVLNGYGPTENTTFTCVHPVRRPLDGAAVPIGRPIAGTSVLVLDEDLRPVPDGAVGELYAAGAGLAHGYLNDAVLTAARFLPHPAPRVPGERMYRTGDLVRRRPDGALDFLGRRDGQLKIRGFRVETGEVVAALHSLPGVARAEVVARRRPSGDQQLVAYVVGAAGDPASALEIRRQLAQRLPHYAIPALVRVVDRLPLTPNGKVDRAALEGRDSARRPEVHAEHREPGSPLEAEIAALWSDHLGFDGIGADDDFFELGGDSLLAVRIIAELRQGYGVEISPVDFYLDGTPAGLARTVEKALVKAA